MIALSDQLVTVAFVLGSALAASSLVAVALVASVLYDRWRDRRAGDTSRGCPQ